MKRSKAIVANTAAELAKTLGPARADGTEIQLRCDLNSKIVAIVVGKEGSEKKRS